MVLTGGDLVDPNNKRNAPRCLSEANAPATTNRRVTFAIVRPEVRILSAVSGQSTQSERINRATVVERRLGILSDTFEEREETEVCQQTQSKGANLRARKLLSIL
jgi:hypothetical protein